jgi:hypothetical protein
VAGVSVDPPSRNAAMVDKLDLPFSLLSDPRGDYIKRLGLWNEEEGVSEPAIVALDRSGTVRYLYSGGTDFADRPQEESLLYILDKVGGDGQHYEGDEPSARISAAEAEAESVRPEKPVITLEQLRPYYQGVYFATVSMKKLSEEGLEGGNLARRLEGYQELVTEYNAAIKETLEANSQ